MSDRYSDRKLQHRLPSNQATGLVRVVDGIAWTLPALTRHGAEQARIRLTDLATALGYSDKAQLKLLAGRHEKEVAEFGTTCTVKVVSGFGRVTDEPTYNADQAAYLALSYETAQGRACRVRILKAYKSLLAMFERVVQSQPASPIIDYTVMGALVATAVVAALVPLVEAGLIGTPSVAPE